MPKPHRSSESGHMAPAEKITISPAAKRALAEAKARRSEPTKESGETEIGGRGGLDPVRYGDWEKDGIAVDF